MAKKKVNRKKALRKEAADFRRKAGQKIERVVKAVEEAPQKVASTITTSFEAFSNIKELAGLPEARLKTFYEEGITSLEAFATWTEKELLALKGIGPATIKQLKEKGIDFKA
ncbi:helix-hairpin-helix domain-containing protein [Streptococcus sp. SGI.013]|uniref:helix-hairpin-helix domain-containing protein n=1 Tax=unclassified Streptococcus TaxID=2608887 RepID=UPI003D0042DB